MGALRATYSVIVSQGELLAALIREVEDELRIFAIFFRRECLYVQTRACRGQSHRKR